MKTVSIILILTSALLFSGCANFGYDAEDAANDRRQDLGGYLLNKQGHSQTVYE